ncbi:hypothetical protein TTHERM_001541731 (macronuclear) [Tetrahymena thermophila SB210]|uniref:Uncharacterized protein n=1 Tax=Tetrahymena thermophila (strain SB210) TaxID=312017 RepID=W7X7F3_TETTS|nr:hypothetical protein TTHERM_001541731 [Tetrahymena thermophila SB210]EWS75300.1 hypothetical protein TTHERM_001541731 [Tetrahymena thermophila SB210]|eukprot:XP_012652163.1 hypothetical protein TTHERM_001541731 [Tetrahymena thermophila SB210]
MSSTKNKDEKCSSKSCEDYYEMHKIVNSIQSKKMIKVNIPKEIDTNILQEIRDKSFLLNTLVERIMKGYIFNQTNTKIIFQLKKYTLEKTFKQFAQNYLPQIAYDLHELQ